MLRGSDRDASVGVLDAFLDAGGRSIDTADVDDETAGRDAATDPVPTVGEPGIVEVPCLWLAGELLSAATEPVSA